MLHISITLLLHIEVVPHHLYSCSFLLSLVCLLRPCLICLRPVLGWVHTEGAQYVLTVEVSEGNGLMDLRGVLPSHALLPGHSLLPAPMRAPLSLHIPLAPRGPWEGQANTVVGGDVA